MDEHANEPVRVLGHPGPLKPGLRVKLYDFRRPDKFSKDQIRTVSILHETFARLTTTSLSAALRCLAHLRVDLVDQMTYEEFIRSLPNPATLAVVNMDPLQGNAVLEIDPNLTFAMIDRLFGGEGRDCGLTRDLTDIELSVMEALTLRILGNLRESWSTLIDLRPRLGQIETNPQFAQIVPPNEMVILVGFTFMIEGVEGRMNFCIPYLTIEPIIQKLSAQYWYSAVRLKDGSVRRDVSRLQADASVFFEAGSLALADVARLKKNSLVRLEDYSTAWLAAGGRAVCRLRTRPARGRLEFTVAAAETPEEDAVQNLAGEPSPAADREAGRLQHLVREPLEQLAAEMKGALETLAGKVTALQKRQEELGDRLFRGAPAGPDNGAPGNGGDGRPFGFIGNYETEALFNFLSLEHPQTKALVLSFLDPTAAVDFLSRLSEAEQADVAERIGTMNPVAPEVIREVERVLEKKLLWNRKESVRRPDPEALINILNVSDRKLEKNVVGRLEKTRPELAEKVKRSMFLFEHLVLLDQSAIKLLLGKIEPRDLLFSLKAVDQKTRDHFLTHLQPEARTKFNEDFQYLGPVRLADVEAAQQRIIGVVRRLEESGEIVIARSGEEIVG